MRQWRAMAATLRVTFPDAIAGLYTYEEMGGVVNDDGELVSIPEPEFKVIETPKVEKQSVTAATNDPAKLVAKAQAIKSKAYDAMLEEFKTIRAEIKVRDESKWVQYKGNDIDSEEKLAPLLQLQKEILAGLPELKF